MDQLLQLPMTADEERHLLQHMRSSTEPHSDEVLVLHYFQRSRIIEALHHNSRLKNSTLVCISYPVCPLTWFSPVDAIIAI